MAHGYEVHGAGWARLAVEVAGPPPLKSRRQELAELLATVNLLPVSQVEDVSMHLIERASEKDQDALLGDDIVSIENCFSPLVLDRVYWKGLFAHLVDKKASADAKRLVARLNNDHFLTKPEMLLMGLAGMDKSIKRRAFDKRARQKHLKGNGSRG